MSRIQENTLETIKNRKISTSVYLNGIYCTEVLEIIKLIIKIIFKWKNFRWSESFEFYVVHHRNHNNEKHLFLFILAFSMPSKHVPGAQKSVYFYPRQMRKAENPQIAPTSVSLLTQETTRCRGSHSAFDAACDAIGDIYSVM